MKKTANEAHNKAISHGRQKAPLVPRDAFLPPVNCGVIRMEKE
jgi:hypothetical protein